MEEQNIGNQMGQKSDRSMRETFKSGSPDEVRDKVKDTVEKGIAAVAGALRGFSERSEREQLPEKTKGAIHQAGESARSTVSSVEQESRDLKPKIQEAGQKLRETAREVSSTVRSEVDQTKSAMKEEPQAKGSSGGSGSTPQGGGAYGTTMGMGGSTLESGRDVPDIRNTPLSKTDKELKDRDLSKE